MIKDQSAGRTVGQTVIASCYLNSLKVPMENGIRMTAFLSIMTGG